VQSSSPSVLALIFDFKRQTKNAKNMASGGNLCNTLFYETLSKQKKGCFGLRIKAVFIFLKSIFIARVFIKKVQAVFGIKIGGIICDEVTVVTM